MKIEFDNNEIKKCFEFAHAMKGNHNPDLIQKKKIFEDI